MRSNPNACVKPLSGSHSPSSLKSHAQAGGRTIEEGYSKASRARSLLPPPNHPARPPPYPGPPSLLPALQPTRPPRPPAAMSAIEKLAEGRHARRRIFGPLGGPPAASTPLVVTGKEGRNEEKGGKGDSCMCERAPRASTENMPRANGHGHRPRTSCLSCH